MKTLFFTLFILLFSGCNNDDSKNSIYPKTISFTLVGQGNLNGNGGENISKQNVAINNVNAWNQLISQINTVNNVLDNFTEVEIDFENYMIIAVFDEIKPNGGHSIDVTAIVESRTAISITVENLLKGDATSVITQPFHIVKIPISNKSIVFQ